LFEVFEAACFSKDREFIFAILTQKMDSSLLIVMMLCAGVMMAMFPFAVFYGLTRLIGAQADDPRLLVVYVVGSAVLMYAVSLGAFALLQRSNCGAVKNMKQVAINASISAAIQTFAAGVAVLIPGTLGIVTGLFPVELDSTTAAAIGYAYYNLWGALFGTAIGGTFSAVC
jgi:hypothetical protein